MSTPLDALFKDDPTYKKENISTKKSCNWFKILTVHIDFFST